MQTRRVRVIVLVIQLLLQVTLLLSRLPGVLGRRRWGGVIFVVHARSPPKRLQTFSGRISQITRFETRLTCRATKILVLQKLSHNAMLDVGRTDSGAVKH